MAAKTKEHLMKKFYYVSVFTLVAGLFSLICVDADATQKKVVNSGNATAKGGNGGNAQGAGSQGGNGGSASAKGGSVITDKAGQVINSGNASATGGSGGNAKGKGSKGGNGGDAVAVGGDIGPAPKKTIPIDPGIGNGKDPKKDPKDKGPSAGGGGGGTAKAGDATATGGNGGNANGKGAKGGNGGDAIAVSGNGNTVINGDNNTVIGKVVNNNISVNVGGFGGFGGGFVTGGGGAFASAGSGGSGFVQGTPGVAIASAGGETVITGDGSPAIATGSNGKDNTEGEVEQVFTSRFVKVKNDTDAPMKVFLQFRGQVDKKWAWLPADPSESKDALAYDLKPGQEMYLDTKGSKVAASRVRIWGVAESQSWLDFRDQDLWVVPEMDQRGEHRYQATEMKTFTFVFPKKVSE
jgi:hypothetical protein